MNDPQPEAPSVRADPTGRGTQAPPTTDPLRGLEPAQATGAYVPADEQPEQFGRYTIRRLLGRGGMGAVYLAHDPELDRPVALKVPKLSGPSAEERFLREARAAAAVTHPNLCPVYDVGRADGGPYLAMEYVPGPALAQELRDGPLPPARVAALAVGIARGMAEAHRRGIVHRDLKPGNVLLSPRGEPVVTDFGVALRAGTPGEATGAITATPSDPRLTQVGVIVGTPSYMPPEQARGEVERVGPAADIYALGVILFELLTGQVPFRADTVRELLHKIETEPPPVASAVRPGIPAGLDTVVQRALAKDPEARFPSMDALAEALTRFTAPPRQRRRWVVALLGLVLLTIAGVVFSIATDNGTVEVRLNDPAANVQVAVDGNELTVTEGTRVTKLRAGPHALQVKGPDFETETREFRVTRGKKTVLEIELKPKNPLAIANPPSPKVEALPKPAANRDRLAQLLAESHKLIFEGKIDSLQRVAEEAMTLDPESPGALALQATVKFLQNKDHAGALADAEAALKLNPETARALIARASVNSLAGKSNEAIADLTIAARLDPTNGGVYSARSKAYLAIKEFHQGIADATRAIELGYRSGDSYVNRAASHVFLGEYAKALADYDEALKRVPSPRYYLERSAVYARLGQLDKAGADWRAAKELAPELTEDARFGVPALPRRPERKKLTAKESAEVARHVREAESAYHRGALADARQRVGEAFQIDPTDAVVRMWRARVMDDNDPAAAEAEATEAIRLDPDLTFPYVTRGLARISRGNVEAGIADLTIAVTRDPTNPYAWNNRGWGYMNRGQYRQALADFDEGIRQRADVAILFINRGWCHVRLGEYQKSLADHETAVQLQPMHARLRLHLAAVRARLGDADGARKAREEAVRLDGKLKEEPDVQLPRPEPLPRQDPVP